MTAGLDAGVAPRAAEAPAVDVAATAGAISRGRFGLDEFDLAVRMAEFRELGLQQRVIARVVHQAEMIFKFGIEADGQECFSRTKPDALPRR